MRHLRQPEGAAEVLNGVGQVRCTVVTEELRHDLIVASVVVLSVLHERRIPIPILLRGDGAEGAERRKGLISIFGSEARAWERLLVPTVVSVVIKVSVTLPFPSRIVRNRVLRRLISVAGGAGNDWA